MAILKGGLNKEYEPQHGEIERPLTPGLVEEFTDLSENRLCLTTEDIAAYRQLHQEHRDLFTAPGITKIPAAQAGSARFHHAIDVEYGKIIATIIHPGSGIVLKTDGVANCMACGAIAQRSDGTMVLGLGHYTGVSGRQLQTPKQFLQAFMAKMLDPELGANPETVKLYLNGGEMATAESNDANTMADEAEFLALRTSFPIVAARMHSTVVDCNSDGDTISRFTNDEHNAEINVIQTEHGMLFSHADFA